MSLQILKVYQARGKMSKDKINILIYPEKAFFFLIQVETNISLNHLGRKENSSFNILIKNYTGLGFLSITLKDTGSIQKTILLIAKRLFMYESKRHFQTCKNSKALAQNIYPTPQNKNSNIEKMKYKMTGNKN